MTEEGAQLSVCDREKEYGIVHLKMTILSLTFMKNVNVVETFLIWTSTR